MELIARTEPRKIRAPNGIAAASVPRLDFPKVSWVDACPIRKITSTIPAIRKENCYIVAKTDPLSKPS